MSRKNRRKIESYQQSTHHKGHEGHEGKPDNMRKMISKGFTLVPFVSFVVDFLKCGARHG